MPKFDDYTQKTTPEDTDIALILDKTANVNKKTPFSGIWTWIVNKMTNAVIQNLQTTNKTVIGSINELNSKIMNVKLDAFTIGDTNAPREYTYTTVAVIILGRKVAEAKAIYLCDAANGITTFFEDDEVSISVSNKTVTISCSSTKFRQGIVIFS